MRPVKINFFDKLITAFSPAAGLARAGNRFKLQALADNGFVIPGSRKKAMKGITAVAGSPKQDITGKLDGMRAISRDLAMNSPLVAAILNRHTVQSVGSGLQLQARPDAEFLGLSEAAADMAQRTFEREFDLYADSLNVDYDGINNLGGLMSQGVYNMILSGDCFFMFVYKQSREAEYPYNLTVKLIDADLIRDPSGLDYRDKDIEGGVQLNQDGEIEGYHIWNTYPHEYAFNKTGKSVFVPLYNSEGQRQIEHVFDPKRIKQRRGIPLIAPIAEPAKQLTRLADAELMNTLVASFFTVMVRDSSGLSSYLPDALPPEETVTGGGSYGPDTSSVYPKNEYDGNDLEMGYGNVVYLDDNKDISIAEPRKTDRDFGAFWEA